ncbi:hypothetical protein [Oceanirhabdus sp. W0125-5]|uniref:hypothetical protein n=1 Tax=Oceanirhabdus sp. W0125-5 TaxID=2999116 RepID=UPI0022F2D17E|nr:hypothetical protein [Oceanirhabdus sp. W0125-5]WBW95268.1 hypothetical protein OW730_16420 [Oceanirhabdus sp. W0125-5]
MDGLFGIVISSLLIIGTTAKPKLFWEHPKTVRIRKSFGDSDTTKIFLVLGIIGVIVGIARAFNFL